MGNVIIINIDDPEGTVFESILEVVNAQDQEFGKMEISNSENLVFPGLVLDQTEYKVLHDGQEIKLTPYEYKTLYYLASHPGRVFTKEQIYHFAFGDEDVVDIDNSIYCVIQSIRKKLETDPAHPVYILNVRGIGYRFGQYPSKNTGRKDGGS